VSEVECLNKSPDASRMSKAVEQLVAASCINENLLRGPWHQTSCWQLRNHER
jgi:hypothetical protein